MIIGQLKSWRVLKSRALSSFLPLFSFNHESRVNDPLWWRKVGDIILFEVNFGWIQHFALSLRFLNWPIVSRRKKVYWPFKFFPRYWWRNPSVYHKSALHISRGLQLCRNNWLEVKHENPPHLVICYYLIVFILLVILDTHRLIKLF